MDDDLETIAEREEYDENYEVIFRNCNVCGRKLHYCVENEMGLCLNCAEE